jgi:phosphatidate cytidylyltransferase
VGVGGGLAAAVLVSLLLWRPAFLAVVVAAVCVGIWEMVRAFGHPAARPAGGSAAARPPLVPLLAGGVAMPAAAWFGGPEALGLGLLGTVLAVLVWRLSGDPAGYQRDVGAAALTAVYLPFLAGFAALLGAPGDGHWRVLAMLLVVVLSDTGGYVVGAFLGGHPLAPAISPKKSWEGLAGSLLAATAGGSVGLAVLFGVDWWRGALFGLLVAGASVLGDLVESMLKRDLGVKDMSGLLPGHGGMLDRVDSILFAAPAAYLLLGLLAP